MIEICTATFAKVVYLGQDYAGMCGIDFVFTLFVNTRNQHEFNKRTLYF